MHRKEKECGQSILIIAFIVLVLLALVALVVDVGNAYAHRRMVQNAVDAAALAGARVLAFRGTIDHPESVTHNEVMVMVYAYAELNGLVQEDVRAEFILANGTTTPVLPGSYSAVPSEPWPAVGVRVEGDLPFDTYFAHLLGFPTMVATTDAAAYHTTGPCNGECLFPVIVSIETVLAEGGPTRDRLYVLWEQTQLAPGNFGWLYWVDGGGTMRGEPPQGPEVPTLERNLTPEECRSGLWNRYDEVHGNVGVNFQPVLDLLEHYINSDPPMPVTVPIYSQVSEEGNNTLFMIEGFGRFVLACAHASRAHYTDSCEDDPDVREKLEELGWWPPNKNNNKYLIGKFVDDELTTGFEDGCIDIGISGVSMRPPKSLWMPEWREDE